MAYLNNPWAVTNYQMFGGPYDEEFMTYWSNGGYGGGGGYGGYNSNNHHHPTMMWQNGYNRGWSERAWYEYLYGRHNNHHHHRRSGHRIMHLHQHGNGINNIGQLQQLAGWAPLFGGGGGPRRLEGGGEGADLMGLAAMGMGGMGMGMGMGGCAPPIMQVMGGW